MRYTNENCVENANTFHLSSNKSFTSERLNLFSCELKVVSLIDSLIQIDLLSCFLIWISSVRNRTKKETGSLWAGLVLFIVGLRLNGDTFSLHSYVSSSLFDSAHILFFALYRGRDVMLVAFSFIEAYDYHSCHFLPASWKPSFAPRRNGTGRSLYCETNQWMTLLLNRCKVILEAYLQIILHMSHLTVNTKIHYRTNITSYIKLTHWWTVIKSSIVTSVHCLILKWKPYTLSP